MVVLAFLFVLGVVDFQKVVLAVREVSLVADISLVQVCNKDKKSMFLPFGLIECDNISLPIACYTREKMIDSTILSLISLA